jgi:hypothetical protein
VGVREAKRVTPQKDQDLLDFKEAEGASRIFRAGAENRQPTTTALYAAVTYVLDMSDDDFWSGRRDSNPRPQPWQGCALPLSYTRIRERRRWLAATADLCQMRPTNATGLRRRREPSDDRGFKGKRLNPSKLAQIAAQYPFFDHRRAWLERSATLNIFIYGGSRPNGATVRKPIEIGPATRHLGKRTYEPADGAMLEGPSRISQARIP